MSDNAFEAPEDRIARALMGTRQKPRLPNAFDRSVDFNGSTRENQQVMAANALGGFGTLAGGAYGVGNSLLNAARGRGLGLGWEAMNALAHAGLGSIGGTLAGSMIDYGRDDKPIIQANSNYREMSNPEGSEQRIGAGLSGPDRNPAQRLSRPPRSFSP